MRRDLLLFALAIATFAGITAWLAAGGPLLELDLAVYRFAERHRPPAADTVARVLNRFGQGLWLLTICAAVAVWITVLRWRTTLGDRAGQIRFYIGPLSFVTLAAVLVVPPVRIVKEWTDRGAPSSELPPEQTVVLFGALPVGEYAAGYPGGHAVNAVVWYGVLLALVTVLCTEYGRSEPARWVRLLVRVGPPVLVLATTTYLSFHWLSDGLAGLALGLAIDRLLAMARPYLAARGPGARRDRWDRDHCG